MNKLVTSVGDILETHNLDTFITPQINHIEMTMEKEHLIATDDVDPLTQTDDDVQHLADIVERKNKRRSRTEEDKSTSNREKYPLLPPCPSTCRKKCSELFHEDQRSTINDRYWSLNFGERRQW